ncbi:disease resistance protein RGA2-like [Miscanthus floridulus]|uniref:disease resistance protein RGA2-like n=1 Tax=Miscanthus floridulus TaxID=154761 RepID=UPI003458A98C
MDVVGTAVVDAAIGWLVQSVLGSFFTGMMKAWALLKNLENKRFLLKNLENKRFLLVFDDMWEEKDRRGWFSLLAPLKRNRVPGCMILATTRRPSVAKMIGTMDPISVKGLDEKEFWLFFKACAFGNDSYEGHPSLQSIGQQIVIALKGCPLAAWSVDALLNRNVTYEHWRTVQNKWKYLQEDTDDVLPILKLSYDFLPVHMNLIAAPSAATYVCFCCAII